MSNVLDDSALAFHQERTARTQAYEGGDEGLMVTLARREPAPWRYECLDHLDRLRELPANWNSYGALPIADASIDYAKEILVALSSFTGISRPRIAASPSGFVALSWEWEHDTRELDVEVRANGLIGYAYSDENAPSDDTEAETSDVGEIVAILTRW
ncbi:hypothetical protein [Candidatus Laterigemmans baculatus]|uniref:hypothetical protein n=1 Tax=Candidatus Laterigemmans baculatus TaxID=2770505 RepID=UPI0013DD672A|nr:hypothetical protein [Candidatus Laterigemmans baculatus]